MLNELAFSNGYQEGNDDATDRANYRFTLLLDKLGLNSDKYSSIMVSENEEELDQVADMIKEDLKELQERQSRSICPDCKGVGWFCSAYGQIGCECSSSVNCKRCDGKGYIKIK